MKKFPVVLDLETKHSYREVSETRKLGISLVGLYDYRDRKSKIYRENNLNQLFNLLEDAAIIIGFNIKSFDLEVLQGYYPGKIDHFHYFDLLEDIKNIIGRRLALNDLIKATLGKKKTGHGLEAIELYRDGKWEELSRYCTDDVLLTKELFEYGANNSEVMYLNEKGKVTIKVDWKKYLTDPGKSESLLTLPF